MNITMKKKLIVTSLLAASVFASAANAGTITVTGLISATPCVITPTSSTQTITMPSITQADLDAVADGAIIDKSATTIKIDLTTCPNLVSNAVVSFSGPITATNKTAFSLGGVEGAALKLYDIKDVEINITNGKAISDKNPLKPQSTQNLEYKLKYVKTSDKLKEGKVNTPITFDIAYN